MRAGLIGAIAGGASADVTAPTLSSAAIANATPSVVNLVFSETLDLTATLLTSAFAISGKTVSSVAFAGSNGINVTVSAAFASIDTPTVTYTKPGAAGNQIKDPTGNATNTFGPSAILNNVSPAAMPLMVATVQNKAAGSNYTKGKTAIDVRWNHVIGSGAKSSILTSDNNWYVGTSSIGGNSNSVQILERSLEYNGYVVPVTWGGLRTITLATTAVDVQSDEIPASAFGVSSLPAGAIIMEKTKYRLALTTEKVCGTSRIVGNVTNATCQSLFYDPAVTTVSSVDTPGVFTLVSGTNFATDFQGPCPFILGRDVAPGQPEKWLAVGDSITDFKADTATVGGLRGWFERCLVDSDGESNPRAGFNMAKDGSQSGAFATQAMAFCQYASRGVAFYLTNDFGTTGTGITVAVGYTRMSGLITKMKTTAPNSKITKVAVGKLLVQTTTTDAWATETNQTYNGGWTPGGNPQTYSNGIAANVTGYDAIIPFDSIRGTDVCKWKADGVANSYASDSTHPSGTGSGRVGGHVVMRNEARPILDAMG